ncbi:MAG: disulfide bond formation protein B [Pseudomonadota bacterium]
MDSSRSVTDFKNMLDQFDAFLKTWRWPAIAMAISAFMLAAAHAFETFALLLPCPLCLRQREVYWAIVAMTATALVLWQIRQNPRFILAFNIMLGLVFLTGTVVAAYHAGVEYRFWPAPSGCGVIAIDLDAIDLSNLNRAQGVPSCTDDPWKGQYGLSMAGWNAVISLGLAAMSFRAAGISLPRTSALSPAE